MSITSFEGPLPTDFAPADECSQLKLLGSSGAHYYGLYTDSNCLPSGFKTDSSAYYSPGTACPSGYTAQESCTRSNGDATSTITCCPARDDLEMWCRPGPEEQEDALKDMFCTWTAPKDEQTVLLVSFSEVTSAATLDDRFGINAFGLRMVYEPSDIAMPTPTSSTAPVSTATSDLEEDLGGSGGLSTGTKAAIGVIVPLVVIGVFVGLLIWYRRRRRSPGNNVEHQEPPGEEVKKAAMGELGSYGGKETAPPGELDGSAVMAFQGASPQISELDGGSRPLSELPACPPKSVDSEAYGQGANTGPPPRRERGGA